MHPLIRKIKLLTLAFAILASVTVTLVPLSYVKAETRVISLNPSSGHVGAAVQIIANITTENGPYRLMFGQMELKGGNAVGHRVNASFIIPHIPQGTYNITIIDVNAGESSTANFTVLTAYSFKPLLPEPPIQVEQGGNIEISVNITGGKANSEYPKIKVQLPAANLEYEVTNKKIFTDNVGDFYGIFTYPTDFSNGANTNFTGEYKILFNETLVGSFFVGLTDQNEYHRGDLMKIRAVDYSAYDNVTITIKSEDKNIASFDCSVKEGAVEAYWRVPNTILTGNYTVSIAPVPDPKRSAPDMQTFEIPGFKTEISPRNLANESVAHVFIKIFDKMVNETCEAESNGEGVASFWLERGDYNATAYFKGVRVGHLTFNIVNEGKKLSLPCQLTNLNISVVDAQNVNIKIPFISLNLTYSYVSDLNGEGKTEPPRLYQTDITGTLQLRSMLLNAIYVVNASRYGKIFNEGNNSFSNLQLKAWNNIVIVCPVNNLGISVVDAKNQPIAEAAVEAQELMGGLHYGSFTDQNGRALLNCVFGIYRVKIYYHGALLNETEVSLFDHQNLTIQCTLCNLPIYIKIVDYFGQPIPNVNVTLERNGLVLSSKFTETDGKARFIENGGMLTVKVYLHDQNQPVAASTIFVIGERNETNPIEIKIGKYVILAGFLIETAQFTAILAVVAVVIVTLTVEVYSTRRLKSKKSVVEV